MAKPDNEGLNNGVIVLGERYPLGKNIRVFTFADYDNWSFEGRSYASRAPAGSKGTYSRKDGEGPIRLKKENLERLRQKVQMVLLHTDLTPDSKTCWRVLAQRGLSTHFMINWDGTIYQGCDVGRTAIHGGEVNSISIGIDLNSLMKNLRNKKYRPIKDQMYRDSSVMWNGQIYGNLTSSEKNEYNRRIFPPFGKPVMRLDNGARVRAYGYTDAQYTSLVALLKLFTNTLKFFKIQMPWLPGMKINPGLVPKKEGWNGILGHWHVSTQRWDPGPGFQWERVWAMLRNQGNSFPIQLADGQTMSSLQEPLKIRKRASYYYDLNEKGPISLPAKLRATNPDAANYGWFPMGPNQTWNGGILLQSPKGSPVQAMVGSGTIVAARMNRRNARWGSTNFVLIRHEIPIPRAPKRATKGRKRRKKKKTVDENFTFWTLYMHLDYIDIEKTPKKKLPRWMQTLLDLGKDEKKKKKKKRGKSNDDDLDDEDDGLQNLTVPTDVSGGLAAVKEGKIATLDQQEIGVAAGEIIGTVGQFGVPADQDESPSEYLKSQVRVSVFADDRWTNAVDMSVHGKYFLLRSQPSTRDRSLLVKNQDIVQAFAAASFSDGNASNPLAKEQILSPSAVQEVYQSGDTADLRKRLHTVVSHHVSEWSDQVDWWRSLTESQDWMKAKTDVNTMMQASGFFRRAYQDVLPFIWLNREVAEKAGITAPKGADGWSGYLWHFHPIYFLLWLTYKTGTLKGEGENIVFSRKLSKKELRARRKAEKNYAKKHSKDENRERTFDDCGPDSESGGATGLDCVYESLDFVVDDGVDVRSLLNEWFQMDPDQNDWTYEQAELDD